MARILIVEDDPWSQRIVADVLGISVAEEDSKSRVRIRQVHRGNLRPIRTAEFQDRSTVPVSRLLRRKISLSEKKIATSSTPM